MEELLHDELRAGGASRLEAESRAELEFELCQREGRPAVLACIAVEGIERLASDPAHRRELLRAIMATLRGYPRSGGLCAWRDGDRIHAFLPGSTTDAAELAARLLIEAARKLAVDGSALSVRASLAIGISAIQPELDLWFETLVRVAQEGVEVASANGAECFVHTQLYGLYQRKIERERPRPARAVAANAQAGAARAPGAAGAPLPAVPIAAGSAAAAPAFAATSFTSQGPAPIAGAPAAPDPRLASIVRAEIARVAGNAPGIADLEPHLLALAHGFAQTAIDSALGEERARHAREIDQLERRLSKLVQSLDETEEELRRVQNLKSVDGGVASAYRYVQGLTLDSQSYERKLGLLTAIVEQNLVLQREILAERSA